FMVKESPAPIEPPKSDPVPVPPPRVPSPTALPPEPFPFPLPTEPDASVPATAAAGKSKKPEKTRPTAKPPAPAGADAKIVEPARGAPPKVKEVVWSEGTNVPPPKGKKPMRPELLDETDDHPIVRRKKKKDRRVLYLIGAFVAIGVLLVFTVLYVLRLQDITEKNLAKQAD